MKEEARNREEAGRKPEGLDLQIAEAERNLRIAQEDVKNLPAETANRILDPLRSALRKLKERKAGKNDKKYYTGYTPWRTEVRSRIWMDTIKRRIEMLGLKIEFAGAEKITLRGKQCGVLTQDLSAIGLVEDEDFQVETWQMTLEAAREFYKRENQRILEEREERLRKMAEESKKWSNQVTITERNVRFSNVMGNENYEVVM